ncbi:MAG TPA: TfoX/Sxy family protein [Nitrospira sp.]|nr:TfoX/Sxy family protein [Nitrospira sp.]
MPTKNDGFKDFILDQLTELNGVTARAMFGGYGLYQRAAFFGIIHKGRLYFKVSTTTVHNYMDHGMKPLRPNPKQTLKSFYEVPIDVIEDAEFLTQWAIEAAEG